MYAALGGHKELPDSRERLRPAVQEDPEGCRAYGRAPHWFAGVSRSSILPQLLYLEFMWTFILKCRLLPDRSMKRCCSMPWTSWRILGASKGYKQNDNAHSLPKVIITPACYLLIYIILIHRYETKSANKYYILITDVPLCHVSIYCRELVSENFHIGTSRS